MENELNKEKNVLEELVKTLPQKIKTYISSGRFENDIKTISQKNSLSEEQENKLKRECAFVLIGAESPEGMSSNLDKELSETNNKKEVLASVTSLLDPFIDDLARIYIQHYEKIEKDALKQGAPVPPPIPPEGINVNDKENDLSSENEQGSQDKKAESLKALTYREENEAENKKQNDNSNTPEKDSEMITPSSKEENPEQQEDDRERQGGENI